MKKSIAFIDHSYHKKTKSSDFFKLILSDSFIIDEIWDDSWQGGDDIDYSNMDNYDRIIFWQTIPDFKKLLKINRPIFFVPMYDSVRKDPLFWYTLALLQINVICFTKKITMLCEQFNINYFSAQYYIELQSDTKQKVIPNNFPRQILFWYRGDIDFKDVKYLINPVQIKQLIIIDNPDPGYKPIEINDMDKKIFKIQIVKDNDLKGGKNYYLRLLKNSDVFIAPRKQEGIGMSFIEALSLDLCVIAYDDASMNEYINNENNGYLFSNKAQNQVNLASIGNVIENSRQTYFEGLKSWELSKKSIIDFIKFCQSASHRNVVLIHVILTFEGLLKFIAKIVSFKSS